MTYDLTLRKTFAALTEPHLAFNDDRNYQHAHHDTKQFDRSLGRRVDISDIFASMMEVPFFAEKGNHFAEEVANTEYKFLGVVRDPYAEEFSNGSHCDHCGAGLNILTKSKESFSLCIVCEEYFHDTELFSNSSSRLLGE